MTLSPFQYRSEVGNFRLLQDRLDFQPTRTLDALSECERNSDFGVRMAIDGEFAMPVVHLTKLQQVVANEIVRPRAAMNARSVFPRIDSSITEGNEGSS